RTITLRLLQPNPLRRRPDKRQPVAIDLRDWSRVKAVAHPPARRRRRPLLLPPSTSRAIQRGRDRCISSRAVAIASQVQTLPFRATQGPSYARADARRQARARTASCGRGGGERWVLGQLLNFLMASS